MPIALIAASTTARLVSRLISELMPSCLVEVGAVIPASPSAWARYSRPVFTNKSLEARYCGGSKTSRAQASTCGSTRASRILQRWRKAVATISRTLIID